MITRRNRFRRFGPIRPKLRSTKTTMGPSAFGPIHGGRLRIGPGRGGQALAGTGANIAEEFAGHGGPGGDPGPREALKLWPRLPMRATPSNAVRERTGRSWSPFVRCQSIYRRRRHRAKSKRNRSIFCSIGFIGSNAMRDWASDIARSQRPRCRRAAPDGDSIAARCVLVQRRTTDGGGPQAHSAAHEPGRRSGRSALWPRFPGGAAPGGPAVRGGNSLSARSVRSVRAVDILDLTALLSRQGMHAPMMWRSPRRDRSGPFVYVGRKDEAGKAGAIFQANPCDCGRCRARCGDSPGAVGRCSQGHAEALPHLILDAPTAQVPVFKEMGYIENDVSKSSQVHFWP